MTKQSYLDDSYQKEFTAKVINVVGNKVVLDQTHFFIQGAGQSGDSGEINGIKVIDTQKGGFHVLAQAPNFKVGDTVTGKIDWDKRYKTMRLHSASHITEYFVIKTCGEKEILKTNVNPKRDFSDYKMDMPSEDIQKEIERKTNEFIAKNLDITNTTDEKGYRTWSCLDISTGCTGTHVKDTSEIGSVKVIFEQKEDGVVRVETRFAN